MNQKIRQLISGVFVFAAVGLGLCFVAAWAPQNSQAAQVPACPDVSKGETAEDCPWADVARSLVQVADTGGNLGQRLDELLPTFMEQIKSASSQTEFKAAWGQSINFDEGVKATVVDPRILDVLIERFGVQKRNNL
ncbi:MAG: hypothetical protein H7222_03485, partial [Methylotenera sp.]|nr:hypothetical protein [Oligoflexia bacterium]